MKVSEFRKLIREEVRKIISESSKNKNRKHTFESFLNKDTANVQKSYWLILNDPNKWAMEQFGHDTSKLTRGEQKEFDHFLELAKKNYKE